MYRDADGKKGCVIDTYKITMFAVICEFIKNNHNLFVTVGWCQRSPYVHAKSCLGLFEGYIMFHTLTSLLREYTHI